MTEQRHRVAVNFVGNPPAERLARASEVSQAEIDGSVVRRLVCGTFQSFLEALRGHEVVSLEATPDRPAPETGEAT